MSQPEPILCGFMLSILCINESLVLLPPLAWTHPPTEAPPIFCGFSLWAFFFYLLTPRTSHPTPPPPHHRSPPLRRLARRLFPTPHARPAPPSLAHRSPRARARARASPRSPASSASTTHSSRLSRTEPGAAPPRCREPSSVPRRFPNPRRLSPLAFDVDPRTSLPLYTTPCRRQSPLPQSSRRLEETMASRAAPALAPRTA